MDPKRNILFSIARQSDNLAKTEDFLANRLQPLLKRHETVLICFPNEGNASLGSIFYNAIHKVGAVPLFSGPDERWKTMLRTALQRRVTAIVAPPSIALGLAKTARATNTPISVRTVILAGYPSTKWIVEGIKQWLDCSIYGCYAPGCGAVVAGFSCGTGYGIHLRSDLYTAELEPDSKEIILKSKQFPDAFFATGECGEIVFERCQCGASEMRLENLSPGTHTDRRLMQLAEQLLTWSSILDYRAVQTSFGIDLEVIVFPGEKLPHLPSCAKLTLRAWDPDTDIPFFFQNASRIPQLPIENG